MMWKATNAVRVEQQNSSDRNTTEMNHHVVMVEFLPEELAGRESVSRPLRVQFNKPILMTAVVKSEEEKKAFVEQRKKHDFGLFRIATTQTYSTEGTRYVQEANHK